MPIHNSCLLSKRDLEKACSLPSILSRTMHLFMHFSFFFSLKRYYSLLKRAAWSHGIERGYVSIVLCAGESRLSHARAECVNLYQSICYYIQRLHSCFPGNGSGIPLDNANSFLYFNNLLNGPPECVAAHSAVYFSCSCEIFALRICL